MELVGSLPRSQKLTSKLYLEPTELHLHTHSYPVYLLFVVYLATLSVAHTI
jgi:hypothetical protein